MPTFAEHPGTIKRVTLYDNKTEIVPIDKTRGDGNFVYFKNDVETNNPAEATERIPIVEEHMISTDEKGVLVAPEKAVRMVIKEFGPEHRPLRSTTLLRNR